MEAVKALAYFEEGEAAEVDAATRRYLVEHAGRWDLTVSTIARAANTLM